MITWDKTKQEALEIVPNQLHEPETAYDISTQATVEAHWKNAVVTRSKGELLAVVRRIRGKNKQPAKSGAQT
ncbi:MAG: hypothetical protein R3F02_04035 [Thiolinea sp.]